MLISLSLSLFGENFPRHWPSLHFLFHLPYPIRYKRHPSTRRGWKLLLCETVRVEIKFPIRFHKYAVRIRDFRKIRNLHSTASTHKGSRAQRSFLSLQSCHVCIALNSGGIAIRFRQPNHYRIRHGGAQCRDSTAFCRITFPELHRFSASQPPSSHCENPHPRSKVE